MLKFFVSCLIALALATSASAGENRHRGTGTYAGKCEKGVYVAQLKSCILHDVISSSGEAAHKGVPDVKDDPRCEGKPAGFRYETRVPHPTEKGVFGTAHHVCGSRR